MQDNLSFTILQLEETTSTNDAIKEKLSKTDLPPFFTITSEYQTKGRGQVQNTWESARGENLLFSTFINSSGISAASQFVISQITSLAICHTLDNYINNTEIKWPNDIYCKGRKIAGILIEHLLKPYSSSEIAKLDYSIIGIGLNVNQKVFCSDATNPVSMIQIKNQKFDRNKILIEYLEKLKEYFEYYLYNHAELKNEYMNRLMNKIGIYNYKDAHSVFQATMEDIEQSGLLVLRKTSGVIAKYKFKEVIFIK